MTQTARPRFLLYFILASGCSTEEPVRTDRRAHACAIVNNGDHYRFDVETDVFHVSREVATQVAADPAGALSCGAMLADDWGLELTTRTDWPSYTHFKEGDRLASVNGEHEPAAMLAQIERAAASGGSIAVVYQRGTLEFGYVEQVSFFAFN